MRTFVIGIIILVIGGIIYGKFLEHIFKPDDRPTPAYTKRDGVDFVPMNKWKNTLINLLNIAGTGPIFGPIQGILFGPIAFITIPIVCIISGATHDYLCGMLSMRQGGAQMPRIINKFLSRKAYHIYNIFVCFLLLLISVVFTYTPGDLFASHIVGIDGINAWTWIIYAAILVYYLLATLLPINKIIGRIYPFFGALLVFITVAIFLGIFLKNYHLMDLSEVGSFKGIFNMYPLWNAEGNTGSGTAFIPVFFVTVACGITSGFHSTQCTMIARSVNHERDGKSIFYWPMIAEGFIALIWAGAAMGIYNAGSTSDTTGIVGEIALDILGPIGGIIAIIGVIVFPITSGDTAIRSCRLILAEIFHVDQKAIKNRVILTLIIFIPLTLMLVFAKINPSGFQVLWRYFAWDNQVIAVFAFAAISVYLFAKKGAPKYTFLISLLPGSFYMFIVSSFIISEKIGFGLSLNISYIIALVLTIAYMAILITIGKKHSARQLED